MPSPDPSVTALALTAAGSAFLPRARAVLDAEQAAREAMAELRASQAMLLRIGTNVGLGTRLERVLTALADRAPRARPWNW